MDEVWSTESAITNSYPTSANVIIVLLNTKHWMRIFRILISKTRVFSYFEGKFTMIKLSVSIFGQTAGSRIYTVHVGRKPVGRELIRLPEIQYPVFGI